jgi:structural maintenance of chromosomes protein 5
MSPPQLLRETQRAAGDPRLTNWHDTLISTGKETAQLAEACCVKYSHGFFVLT